MCETADNHALEPETAVESKDLENEVRGMQLKRVVHGFLMSFDISPDVSKPLSSLNPSEAVELPLHELSCDLQHPSTLLELSTMRQVAKQNPSTKQALGMNIATAGHPATQIGRGHLGVLHVLQVCHDIRFWYPL